MPKNKSLKQAYDLQDLAHEAVMSMINALRNEAGTIVVSREDAQGIAALVKSWDMAQERVRLHRGKPLPGSLRPEQKRSKLRIAAQESHAQPLDLATIRAALAHRPAADPAADGTLPVALQGHGGLPE